MAVIGIVYTTRGIHHLFWKSIWTGRHEPVASAATSVEEFELMFRGTLGARTISWSCWSLVASTRSIMTKKQKCLPAEHRGRTKINRKKCKWRSPSLEWSSITTIFEDTLRCGQERRKKGGRGGWRARKEGTEWHCAGESWVKWHSR